jgi:two-component sensor histidine kinase
MSERLDVLYIDDDQGLGRLLQRALRPHNLEVHHVSTGADGLALLSTRPFQAVALDHDLGAEVGLHVLAEICALPDAPPVIYVTGSDDVRVAVSALKSGAVDYVWKDTQGHYRELLVQSINSAIEKQRVRQEKAKAEAEARQGRERAEMLLREVNHRVANSLALVAAFAGLQANALQHEAAKRALSEMRGRISAIAGVHRRLYTSADVRFVDMPAYLDSLASDLRAALEDTTRRHSILLDVDDGISIPTDKAVSIGVLITELVTNAFKYAYPDTGDGEIRVGLLRLAPDRFRLTVEDDGVGWTGDGDAKGTGLGSRIIAAMALSLHSQVVHDQAAVGTRVMLEFEIAQGDLPAAAGSP